MRKAVKKPAYSLKRQAKVHGQLSLDQQALSQLTTESLPPEQRLQRARQVPKSKLVNHFTAATAVSVSPRPPDTHLPPPRPYLNDSIGANLRTSRPLKKPETTAELLERGLREATAHTQLPLKNPRYNSLKRQAGIVASLAVAVAVISVIAVQNLSSAQLQVASAKAGFSVKLPNYKPAGFSQGRLNYGAGAVAAQFYSNSDTRSYSITQKSSSWDDATLRDTFVAPIDPNYTTLEASDRTIYIYGNHNATWISSGVWYTVQSNGALNDHQLVDLATSL